MQKPTLKESKVKVESEEKMSAVERTLSILEALSEEEYSNLENLSKSTRLPKATLLRFLSSLIALGYVYRDNDDRYHLTLKMFSVGSKSLNHMDMVSDSYPFVKNLSKAIGETVHVGILEGNEAIYVLKEDSKFSIRMHSSVGRTIPLYCTAIGKIFLSQMSKERLEEYFKEVPLTPFTENSIKTRQALKEELEKIRNQGWAMDNQEHEENIICIACPVRDYSGKIVEALSVSWPLFRYEKAKFEDYLREIENTTSSISTMLGAN